MYNFNHRRPVRNGNWDQGVPILWRGSFGITPKVYPCEVGRSLRRSCSVNRRLPPILMNMNGRSESTLSNMNVPQGRGFHSSAFEDSKALVLLFLFFYFLATVFLMPVLTPWAAPVSFVVFFQLLAIGLAFDLADTSLALLSPQPLDLPRLDTITNRPGVADRKSTRLNS